MIKKGTILKVTHINKGVFIGKASKDFELSDEWYPINLHQKEKLETISDIHYNGERVPCLNYLCSVEEVIKK